MGKKMNNKIKETLLKMCVDSWHTVQITDLILWNVSKPLSANHGKRGFNSAPSKKSLVLSFSSQCSVFQNKPNMSVAKITREKYLELNQTTYHIQVGLPSNKPTSALMFLS